MIKKMSIDYVSWRDGRPRFTGGPAFTAAGLGRTYDLKHPDGTWFTYEEARAESERRKAELASLKTATPSRHPGERRDRDHGATAGRTLAQLSAALLAQPEFRSETVVNGKRVREGLARTTVKNYQDAARYLEAAATRLAEAKNAPSLWHVPVAAFTTPLMQALLHAVEEKHGPYVAQLAKAYASKLWHTLAIKQPGTARHLFAGIETIPKPKARPRPWEPDEFWHMVATADAMGRADMADLWFMGVLHGQRQTDRLTAMMPAEDATHMETEQSKTGVDVRLWIDPWMRQRLAAARARRRAFHTQHLLACINEADNTPWNVLTDRYRKTFAKIRAKAAETMPGLLDVTDATGKIIRARIREKGLRATNQTWLDRANVDARAMRAVSGHQDGLTDVQRQHYVQANQARADAAVAAISQLLTTTSQQQKRNEG